MAYKFTFGSSKLSGSTIFEEELVTSGSLTALGAISSSAAALLHSVNADEIFAQSASFGTAAQASISVAGAAVFASAQVSDLTDNRIVIAGSSGELEDDAKLTFDGTDLTVGAGTRVVAVDITGSGAALLHSVNADEVFAQSASFGTLAQTNIGVLGVISSSAAAELHAIYADEVFIESASFGTAAQASISTGGAAVFASAKVSDLTDNRIVIAGTSGELEDDAKLTFDGADFTLGASTRLIAVDITGSGPALLHSVNADEVFAQSASFGTAAQTNIGTGGVISSSVGATINRLTVPTLIGNMSGNTGASLTLGGALDVGNSRLVVNENLVLMTGPVHVSGAAFQDEDLDVAKLATDSLLYFDAGSGELRRDQFSNYASVLAGTGITNTDGVLSVDTTGGDSMTATHIPADAGGNATLSTGLNFMTTTVTGSSLLLLPSASAGDVVIVKAPAGVNSTNFIKISASVATGDEIDGFSEARIESPFGAVSLIYSNSDGKWVIY